MIHEFSKLNCGKENILANRRSEKDIYIENVNGDDYDKIDDNRGKFLNFFILSQHIKITKSMIYQDEYAPFIIVGEGGRNKEDSIERINLRLLSKKSEKSTSKIFNAIKNKLKKDELIGMGVEGGSAPHNNYFYQKNLVGKKTFKTDFYNDKAPLVNVE